MNITVDKRVWLLVLQAWSQPTYAHHKIYLHEGLEKAGDQSTSWWAMSEI